MCSSDQLKPRIIHFTIVRGLWRRDRDNSIIEEQWLIDNRYEYTVIGEKGYYIEYVK